MTKELGKSKQKSQGPNLDALEARIRARVKDEKYWNTGFRRNGVLDTTPCEDNLTKDECEKRYRNDIVELIRSGKRFSV